MFLKCEVGQFVHVTRVSVLGVDIDMLKIVVRLPVCMLFSDAHLLKVLYSCYPCVDIHAQSRRTFTRVCVVQ